jgi:hypothetical protein
MRRFLEGTDWVNNDHGDADLIRQLDDCWHGRDVNGYSFADDGNGDDHFL